MGLKKISMIISILAVLMVNMFTCNAGTPDSAINQAERNKNIKYFVAMGKASSSGDEKFQCAVQLIKLKDDKDAMYFLKEASDAGIKEASILLGKIYYRGIVNSQISIPKDELQGLKYFLKAEEYEIINQQLSAIKKEANNGNSKYQCFLGQLYLGGHVEPQKSYEERIKKAEGLFLQAAKQGDSEAAFSLAYLYQRIHLYNDSYTWIQKAADMENSTAMFVMYALYSPSVSKNCRAGGFALFNYTMIPKDDSIAIKWLQKGFVKGDLWAKRETAIRYIIGNGIDQNIDLGCRLLSEAAASGDEESMETIRNLKMISAVKSLADDGNVNAKITYNMLIH